MKISAIFTAILFGNAAAQSSKVGYTTISRSISEPAGTYVEGVWYTDFSLASKHASEASEYYAAGRALISAEFASRSASAAAAAAAAAAGSVYPSSTNASLPTSGAATSSTSSSLASTSVSGTVAQSSSSNAASASSGSRTSSSRNSTTVASSSSSSASSQNMAVNPKGAGTRLAAAVAVVLYHAGFN